MEETKKDIEIADATGMTTAKPILNIPTPAALREELQDMVLRDLLGPAGGEEEEVDDFRVHDRYLVGILAPNDTLVPAEELDNQGTNEEGTEESGSNDKDASQTTSLSPSSMGMSFCVDPEATHLQVTARWGHYQKVESQIREARGRSTWIWKRIPRGGQPYTLPLKEGPIDPWEPEPEEQPDVYVKGIICLRQWSTHESRPNSRLSRLPLSSRSTASKIWQSR